MICPLCKCEMAIMGTKEVDGAIELVWSCRNRKCPNYDKAWDKKQEEKSSE